MKRYIPLWVKAPVAVLLKEAGKWPAALVLAHMRRSFAESGGCGEAGKVRAWKAVQAQTLSYLKKRYGRLAESAAGNLGQKQENAPVWVFWWQGEEAAPVLVRRCIRSIRRQAGNHPVRVVDQNNYREFVTIPGHIEEKRDKGIISLTHFSDFLRMALLAEHGGLWLDATIYAADSLAPAFRGELFTVRNPGLEEENVSQWDWSVFAIGGNAGCGLFAGVRELLSAYWLENDWLIDYYVFDYMMRLIVDSCPAIREALEAVTPNNSGIYHYQKHFQDPADTLPPEDTWLFKLSWKGSYSPVNRAGEQTLYGRWLRETEETP